MKKFNPEAELSNLNNKKNRNRNSSKVNNVYVPILVIACSCLALVGVTFSTKIADSTKDMFEVNIEIIGGKLEKYTKVVPRGAFRDTIVGTGTFGSINCTQGNLSYDPLTSAISSVYVNENISCVISFMDDGTKNIAFNSLGQVNDNLGTSYYYRVDADNNYVKINNLMFRIIRINGDGSIRLMLDQDIDTTNYGTFEYSTSNVKKVVDNWFNIYMKDYKYLIDGTYDLSSYDTYDSSSLINLYGYSTMNVGILTVREAELITEGVESKENFLNTSAGLCLGNSDGIQKVYMYKDGKVNGVTPDTNLNVRPVINISSVKLTGYGTLNNPYIIEE